MIGFPKFSYICKEPSCKELNKFYNYVELGEIVYSIGTCEKHTIWATKKLYELQLRFYEINKGSDSIRPHLPGTIDNRGKPK